MNLKELYKIPGDFKVRIFIKKTFYTIVKWDFYNIAKDIRCCFHINCNWEKEIQLWSLII